MIWNETAEGEQLTLTGSKLGWITPRLGEAFLTSAISPGLPVLPCAARSAPMKSRAGGAAFTCIISRARGSLSFIFAISTAFHLE